MLEILRVKELGLNRGVRLDRCNNKPSFSMHVEEIPINASNSSVRIDTKSYSCFFMLFDYSIFVIGFCSWKFRTLSFGET